MKNIDIQLYSTPIDTIVAENFVSAPDCGGITLFVGKVRNKTAGKSVLHLEFEAYEPMAIKEMTKIAERVQLMWPAKRVSIHHRLGTLQIGETAVVIGVACPHRRDSFAACSFAIDTLKQTVPIWKKEIFEDGETWVAAHP